jgi:cell division protein FtsQ
MTPTPFLRQRVIHGVAAAAVIAALAAGAWLGYGAIVSQPIRQVVFTGSTERVASADLDALAASVQAGTRPVAEVREAARRIPWVRDAAVRRRTPGTLEIQLETHEPLARWNDDALVSRRGEIFRATHAAALPRFHGADSAAPLMARQFAALVKAVERLGSPIAHVRLSARGAWQLTLESGLVLELGRGDLDARLARFASAWPELAQRGVKTAHADLRYPNGFALRK